MKQSSRTGGDAPDKASAGWSACTAPTLAAQYTELIEAVWHCERAWNREDRIDAAIKYGRN